MRQRTMVAAVVAAWSALAFATPLGATAQTETTSYRAILESAYAEDAPGAAALVARGDEVLYLDAIGMADLELGVPLAPDMVFEIGSITKQFTAAAIMLLAEEGKLSLSDPITHHLPDYPSYGDGITIEHLLTHTSGIVSYTGIPGYMATEVVRAVTVGELIDVFDDLPVEFAPGERWAYNNSGYILLGAIVEAAGGMPYEEFVQQRIFEPLGLDHAYYGSTSRIIPRRASGYEPGDDGYANQRYLSFTQPYAAGSLMMTVENWYRWSRALFGGEVVGAASLARMTTPFVLNDGSATNYGYGLGIAEVRGHRAIRHGGGIFGFVTDGLYLPEQDVYVAVFSNNTANDIGPALVGSRLAALAIGEPYPTFEPITLAEDVLQRYVGVYRIDGGAERVVTVRDGALYTQRSGGQRIRAYPASETHFFYRTSLSHFEFVVENGEVTGMVMYQEGRSEGEQAARVSDEVPAQETVTLERATLERYVGVYELQPGFDLTVYLEGDRLMTRATGQPAVELHPSSETEFFVEEVAARITFVVTADGSVEELILHQGGRNLPARRKE